MSRYLILLFVLSFVECFSILKSNNSREEVAALIDVYSKDLKKEGIVRRWHGLDCAGPDKIYDGKIHEISLGYSIDKNLKYREARELFYKIADGLLKEINSCDYLQDQFFHHPVTYDDLHFALFFDYEKKGHLRKDDVDQIVIQFNEIAYYVANVDGAADRLVFNESYPGMGTISHTGLDTARRITRKLPESEEAAAIPK